MKKCIIMRGLPGAGKSHWIKNNIPGGPCICSADGFFMVDGRYAFDKYRLPEAHNACLLLFLALIHNHDPNIVVDNTNVRVWELAPYYRVAETAGYNVEIVWVQCNPELCKARNVHNVPPETIDAMVKNFEAIPQHWKMRVVMN